MPLETATPRVPPMPASPSCPATTNVSSQTPEACGATRKPQRSPHSQPLCAKIYGDMQRLLGMLRTLALLSCICFAGCARKALTRMITFDQSSNNTNVSVAVGERFEVTLPENPTTGFRWELKSDARPVCVPCGNTFDPPSAGIGAGGVRRWCFEAVQAGAGTIGLVYRRSFEKDRPPAQAFQLTVRVGN